MKSPKPNYQDTLESLAKRTKTTRVIRFFSDSDLRCGHEGLQQIAQEHGIDCTNLAPGEFVVFANTQRNKLKIYAPGNCIVYHKNPYNQKIDMDIIRLIPRFFNGTEFHYRAALKAMVTAKIEKKGGQEGS